MSYQDGKIYKVICSETGDVYIGSTKDTLKDRLKNHKAPSNNCMSKTFINPIIVLIKDFPCNNKKELEAEEAIFIREGNCVNKNIPGRTPKQRNKQYRLDHVDEIKQYYIDHADEIKQRNKQYRLDNADEMKQYRLDHADEIKQYTKQYNIDHADEIKQYYKQYRLDNVDKLKKKFSCECGGKFTYISKSIHLKTKKHLKFLEKTVINN